MRLIELRQQRGACITQMRALLDTADADKRDLTAEETEVYERLDKKQEELGAQITKEERLVELERTLAARAVESERTVTQHREQHATMTSDTPRATAVPEYRAAFSKMLRLGRDATFSPEEVRALSAVTTAEGGATVVPEEFAKQLIKFIDDSVYIRQLSTVMAVTSAASLGAPSLDADPADADWTTELGTGSEDSTMAFGKRLLTPHPVAKRIKVSEKLMRVSAINVEELVTGRLGYKFAITEEKAFLTGSGVNQPLGVFTASAQGISTGRDVSTGNTSSAITADGLINAKYSLKEGYHSRATWIFHRDAIKEIRKLKDDNEQYIWAPGLASGEPDRILDSPFRMTEYAPNTFTTGLYVGIIGDFANYWIVDALDMSIKRLVELYAETAQVGFIGRLECDAMPTLEEGFARVKLA
jgi:HK97 family phage major capsid protein